jgi:hypothetical protein
MSLEIATKPFYSAALGLALSLCLSLPTWAASPFYRIIVGPNPGPAKAKIDRFRYGTDVLYTGDAKAHPTHIKGTVWHSNLKEAEYFVGTRNPVIEQRATLELIESNKWEEAKFLMQYTPDAFPRTENMAELLHELNLEATQNGPSELLARVSEALKKRYPNGFFLKPVAGFNSVGTFPTETSDFASIYEGYLREVKPVIERRLRETHGDTDTVHLESKELPHYSGRVLEDLLQHPEAVIVQEKINAATGSVIETPKGPKALIVEYRVHVVEGQVLKGATQNRWEDARLISDEAFERVDAFAQRIVNSLPPEMRQMCFGMDVIQTVDGHYKVVELNAGGESGYLYPETDVWVTQLLAANYHEGHAPLLDEMERMKAAPTLEAREHLLEKILKHPELAELTREVAPVTELLTQAKRAFLAELETKPDHAQAMQTLFSLKKFRLEPYLTAPEIQHLTELTGMPESMIATNAVHPAYGASTGLSRLGDEMIIESLLERIHSRLGERSPPSRAEARKLAIELADRHVLSASAPSLESAEAKLFYSGTRESLIVSLVKAAMRR